ncbi:cAMP receptor protein [bacterium BMS3Bbin13]|nr:cAMP receptor protein [bacterium BMS3Bbin13]
MHPPHRSLETTCANPAVPDWLNRFSALRGLSEPVWKRTLQSARVATFPAGTVVFHDGAGCRDYLLVLTGTVRVQKTSEDGHEIVLYRVRAGESCVLTTSCLLAGERYPAQAVTESEVSAVLIPVGAFRDALAGAPGFREFVFEAYGRRIADLIRLVREVSFERIDARLARRLLEKAAGGMVVTATHQALAAELGTAREVVSRQLRAFAWRGWVRAGRGHIRLLDAEALGRLTRCAASPAVQGGEG